MDWLPQYILMMGAGAVMAAVLLLLIPGKVYGFLAGIPGLSPNWVSIWRAPITLIGIAIYICADGSMAQLWTGFLVTAFGLLLDRVDGKMARCIIKRLRMLIHERLISPCGRVDVTICRESKTAPLTKDGELWVWFREQSSAGGEVHHVYTPVLYEEWLQRLTPYWTCVPMFHVAKSKNRRYPGLLMKLTGLGESIDPAADKGIFIPVLTHLACTGSVHAALAILMILSDLVSTVFRHPFDKLPGFRTLQRWVVEEKASPFGKTKVVWQILVLLVLMPELAGWLTLGQIEISYIIANTMLGLGVVSGIISTLSRLTPWRRVTRAYAWFRKFNRRFRRAFEHDIVD